MTDLDEQKPGVISNLKYKIGLSIVSIGTMLVGDHLISIQNNNLNIINAKRVHTPEKGWVVTDPQGNAQFVRAKNYINHLGAKSGIIYESIAQVYDIRSIVMADAHERIWDIIDKGTDKVEDLPDHIPHKDGYTLVDINAVKDKVPFNFDLNSNRRFLGDAEESAKNMIEDNTSKFAKVAEIITYILVGAIVAMMAGGGGGGGGGGLPNPGSMLGMISIDPVQLMTLAGLG